MVRTVIALSVVVLVAMTGGCRMCVDPYDYCGPLYTGDGCGPPCDPMARAGSILSGGCPSCGGQSFDGQPIPDAEMVPGMVRRVRQSARGIRQDRSGPR